MLLDAYPAAPENEPTPLGSFLSFIERRLGVAIVRDARTVPFERPDLSPELSLAQLLQDRGIIRSLAPFAQLPDEPPIKRWSALCRNTAQHPVSGAHAADDALALRATLAEGLERYLWNETDDYFERPVRASVSRIGSYGAYVAPERFAGFDEAARSADARLALPADAPYLWILADSLTSEKKVYLPAQTVSGLPNIRNFEDGAEPVIRLAITTGLATWPEQSRARLHGALEVIERDAYMVTWLNQLSPKRIPLQQFAASASVSKLVARCLKYRLDVHALRLASDAPTHAIAVLVEDRSGRAPRFAIGLKAKQTLADAVEGALIEALRARAAYRRFEREGGVWDESAVAESVGHVERIHYYGSETNARKLEFLLAGEVETAPAAPWEGESAHAHLERIVQWCKARGYELAAVPLGISKRNPLPWSVEMVVIPELQPTYLHEGLRQIGGSRLRMVPEALGLQPRNAPYIEAPHPFA